MQRQTPVNPAALPTRISMPRFASPDVRFGEGYIAPRIAMHHAKELNAPQSDAATANRPGAGRQGR